MLRRVEQGPVVAPGQPRCGGGGGWWLRLWLTGDFAVPVLLVALGLSAADGERGWAALYGAGAAPCVGLLAPVTWTGEGGAGE